MREVLQEQIEHSKELILSGRITDLRLALILLDNVAELLMYQYLQPVFRTDDEFRHARETMILLNMPVPDVFAPPYTPEERHDAEREFRPMLRLVEHRLKKISTAERSILQVAHDLRKDAFHRGQLRKEVLHPICLLLYQTVVGLTAKLPLHEKGAVVRLSGSATLSRPVSPQSPPESLVPAFQFDSQKLCGALANDLVERIDKLLKELGEFFDSANAIDSYLFRMQFGESLPTRVPDYSEPELEALFQDWSVASRPAVTVNNLRRLRRLGEGIRSAKSSADALVRYWSVDERLTKAERDVDRHLERLDRHIQSEIDIARGK